MPPTPRAGSTRRGGALVLAVAAALAAPGAAAAAAQPLGLREALRTAIDHNVQLALEAVDAGISAAEIVQAEGAFDLLLTAEGSYSFSEGFFNDTEQGDTKLTLSRRLPWNGTLALRGEYGRFANKGGTSVFITESPQLQLRVDQPLLRGFGRVQADAARLRASTQRDVDLLDRRARAAEVVRDIAQAYWELAYATQDIAIREAALELAREQLRLTQAEVEIGRLPRNELLGVERAIAQREEEVVVAQGQALQRSVELRQAIGLEISPDAPLLQAGDAPVTGTSPVDVKAVIARAMGQSPTLAAARRAGDKAAIEVEVTRNGLLPQLDVSAFAGPVGNDLTTSPRPPNDLGDSLADLAAFEQLNYGGTITFSLPLGNRASRGAHEAARLGLRRARLQATDIERQITAALIIASSQVATAAKRIEVTRVATRFAEQSLEAERARFEVGRATNFNILERQEELRDARLREVRAAVDYLRAVAQLEALSGDILDRYHIELRASRAAPRRL